MLTIYEIQYIIFSSMDWNVSERNSNKLECIYVSIHAVKPKL